MLKKILISTVAFVATQVLAKDNYVADAKIRAKYTFHMDETEFVEMNFTQIVDHFPPTPTNDAATYQQRYFINDKHFDKDNGPVFLYICGEGTCKPPSDRGYPMQLAIEFGAMFYAVEHRFYGTSQPTADWSTDNLKYLTAEQALADLAGFIDAQNAAIIKQYGGAARKWVTIGGSYPGALSAWFKQAYPDKAAAAWSSSGVILPIRDFTDFDMDIFQATSRSGPECPAFIQSLTTQIETILKNQEQGKGGADFDYLCEVFGITKDANFGDFMFYVADIFTIGVQYGGRIELCQMLESIQFSTFKAQLPVLQQYAKGKGMFFGQYDRVALAQTAYVTDNNMRQWTWQYCTEFGWFQIPAATNPMRSSYIGHDYWVPYCEAVFGAKIGEPKVDYYIQKYGGLDIKADNIFFANSIEDPWQYAGMRTVKNPETQKNLVANLIDCNDCGHCQDLKTPSTGDAPALTIARANLRQQILITWLGLTPIPPKPSGETTFLQ